MDDLISSKPDERGRRIHPTAVVHPGADIDTDVVIGPFSIIGPNVTIGRGSQVGTHVVIDGDTTIGENNQFFTGCVIGSQTQDLKYHGGTRRLIIGNDNMIREYATINTSTSEANATRIGNGNLLMAYTHVAHECTVGDSVVMANNATLAGHVTVHDKAILGGLVAVHQFTRIGTLAIVGGCAKVVKDVMPYSMVDGYPARWHGLNFVGLRRSGVPEEVRTKLKRAYKVIYRSNLNTSQAVERLRAEFDGCPEIDHIIQFIESSSRGVC